MTTIECTKTLYNSGKCFTKGKFYKVSEAKTEASLMERIAINDQKERHQIGSWWKHFKIIS